MKNLFAVILMTISLSAIAHVGGHQEENIFTPKFGGKLAKVENPSTSALIAELAKDGKKGLFLYFYDKGMNLMSAKSSKATVTGKITTGRGKRAKTMDVSFKISNNRFSTDLPEIKKRPYSIAIEVKQNGKVSKINFENLD